MNENFQPPSFLYTARLRLDLLDYSAAHADCLLACLNNPTAYERVGNFGIESIDDLDRMLTGCRLHAFKTSTRSTAVSEEITLVDYDCYYLLRLGVGRASRLIGAVSISQRGGDVPPDIGWSLLEEHHGQGYATEAAKELLRFSRQSMGLVEIVSLLKPANLQSINVAKKIGLVEGGHVREGEDGPLQIVYVLPGMVVNGIPSIVF